MSELKDIRRWKWSDRGFLELDDNGNLCEWDDVKIIVRHQKYKRCLAMAETCAEKKGIFVKLKWFDKATFWRKWQDKWLELAEKFKEAK